MNNEYVTRRREWRVDLYWKVKINVKKLPAISRRETSTNLGQYLLWLKKRGKIKHKLSQANKIHLLDVRSYVFYSPSINYSWVFLIRCFLSVSDILQTNFFSSWFWTTKLILQGKEYVTFILLYLWVKYEPILMASTDF